MGVCRLRYQGFGMKCLKLLYGSLCGLLLLASPAGAEQPLHIYTSSAPPYQYLVGNTVYGSTADALRCALSESQWHPEIRMVPQRRAIHSLRTGAIDGYMAITPSPNIDTFATLSAPLALEKWYLYSLGPIADLSDARLGVVAGSNQAIWLRAQGYRVAMEVTALDQLLALLARGRIDGMVVDLRTMNENLAQNRSTELTADLHRQFIRFAPLGLYVGNSFLQVHPGFLPSFNARLNRCVSSGFQLESGESAQIRALASTLFANLHRQLNLVDSVAGEEHPHTLADILTIDQQWQVAEPLFPSDEARNIAARPLSRFLASWQSLQDGKVTEVLVMDAQGALVAMSQLTSDYWQGDEDKFRQVASKPDDTLYIGPVRFDASSRHFQVIASRPLRDGRSNDLIGVVAIGLDIERALGADFPVRSD